MKEHDSEDKNIRNIRRLIWLYFWLLLLEGALRKWALPQLSNPLLIIRDPVVLLAYFFAIRGRVFPANGWVYALGIIGALSFLQSFIPLWFYVHPKQIVLVAGYGFRSNFLHLPFIFLIARVLRFEDVKRFGWWTLFLTLPMAALMVAQFQAAPDAFINRTAGEGEAMLAALGKVRTAATFSFVIGVVAYFALASAFLIWAALTRGVYKNWLLFAASGALVIGIAVSGSRSVVGACAVVIGSLIGVFVLRPSAVNRFGQALIVALVLGLIVSRMPIFKEGFNVLSTRFTDVAEATEKSIGAGMVERVFSDFTEGLFVLTETPFFGYGLGVGTNAGAKFLTGRTSFLLSEGEWQRVFLESGPVLGLAYVLWRCGLVFRVGLLCARSVRLGNVLPLLLFSSCFLPLISGQFGQPTVLGFTVFVTGLALAAQKSEIEGGLIPSPETPAEAVRPRRPIPQRSPYASRLHGSSTRHDHTNGSVDR
jgi:hypothetical protein